MRHLAAQSHQARLACLRTASRSFEAGEQALLASLGVRVMYMPEVAQRGFAACFAEAVALVRRHTVVWGLSFDLDALDPADAPGTGTPVEAGIRLADAVQAPLQLGGDLFRRVRLVVEHGQPFGAVGVA